MYQIWLKIFFRNSKKNWLNTLINISGLTLGLAGLLIVLLYINEEKNYNQWNPNKDDVYRVNLKQAKNAEVWFTVNAGMYLTFPRELPEVTASLMVKPFYRSKVIKYKDEFEFNEKTIFTEPQFFDFFPFKILEGSTQKFAETRNNIALSKAYANRVFKDDKAVGNTVKIDGESYVVSCVYEIPKNSHQEPDLLIQFDEAFEENWGNHNNEVFCRITEGSDLEGLKKKMNQVIIEKAYRKNVEENGMTIAEFDKAYGIPTVLLDKLDTLYLHNTAKRAGPSGTGNYQLLMVLLGLSILLIVISCVNFINLSVATGTQRAKEVGVKKTLGLSKKQLLFQYISEIILQGFVSFVFALLIVELALPFFNDFVETEISILHTSSLATLFLAAIFVSFLVGSIPAIYLSNFKAIEVLKGSVSKSKKGNLARNIMLGLQFLISGFFIISMLIVGSQINYMMEKDLGFDKEQVLSVDVYSMSEKYKKYKLTKEVLSKKETIIAVTSSMFVPGEGFVNGTGLRHKKNDKSFNSASNVVDFNYLDFAKIKLLKGRNFSEEMSSDSSSKIIINETAVKAGKYALYVIPSKNQWTFIISTYVDGWGVGDYTEATDVVRITAMPKTVELTENLMFVADKITDNGCEINLVWERVSAGFEIDINTTELAQVVLDKTVAEADNSFRAYNNAAKWYLDNNNPVKAVDLAKKSVSQTKKFWNLTVLSEAYYAAGDKKMALKTAKEALEMSEKAEYMPYVKRNAENIDKWNAKK